MKTQRAAECPKCGCDAMAATRRIKRSDILGPEKTESPTPRVFTCDNCGTKFERPDARPEK